MYAKMLQNGRVHVGSGDTDSSGDEEGKSEDGKCGEEECEESKD